MFRKRSMIVKVNENRHFVEDLKSLNYSWIDALQNNQPRLYRIHKHFDHSYQWDPYIESDYLSIHSNRK